MIKNLRDLASALGIDPQDATESYPLEQRIERVVYKSTDCGAWISFDPLTIPIEERITFTVDCRDCIGGPVAVQWRRGRYGKWRGMDAPETPEDLVFYFSASSPVWFGPTKALLRLPEELGMSMAEVRASAVVELWSPPHLGKHLCTVNILIHSSLKRAGITVGSIVEGSDACCTPHDLAYPFSEDEFYAALQSIEDEAQEIWEEANPDDR